MRTFFQHGGLPAFIPGVTDLDPDVFPSPLEAEGLVAEEPGVDLPREVVHGQAQGPGLGAQGEADLVLARRKVGTDLVDAVKAVKPLHEFVRGGQDLPHVIPLNPDLDGRPRGPRADPLHGEGLETGNGSDPPLPFHHDLLGMDSPPGGLQQDGLDRSHVGSPFGDVLQGLADQGDAIHQHGLSGDGLHGLVQLQERVLDVLNGLPGHLEWACRH